MGGQLLDDKSYRNKVCLHRILLVLTPYLVIRIFISSCYREDIFHMGVLSPAFRKDRGGQKSFLYLLVFFKCHISK